MGVIKFLLLIPLGLYSQQDSVNIGWVEHYRSSESSTETVPGAMSIDSLGNSYITGYGWIPGNNTDYVTVKYDPDGTEVWANHYDGPGNNSDDAKDIIIDNDGSVYVTGISTGSGTSSDFATIKYAADGAEEWVARYNGPANSSDEAYGITLDDIGNIYVVGYSNNANGDIDFLTIKYYPNGTEAWVARYNGTGNDDDRAQNIVVDDVGNVYVGGSSEGISSIDYTVVKYGSDGTETWAVRYDGPGNGNDGVAALTVDETGSVFVTGYSNSSGNNYTIATIKYNSNGSEEWVSRYNTEGDYYDAASDIVVNNSGYIYITGFSFNSVSFHDYVTIKYDLDGSVVWTATYNGPASSGDYANDIALDLNGNVYVTGASLNSGNTNYDFATVKYNDIGEELWVTRYSGSHNEYGAKSLAVGSSGDIYVSGSSTEIYPVFTTIKYIQPLYQNTETVINHASVFTLSQNYPNPFTTIEYYLPYQTYTKILIYDILGKEIQLLVSEVQEQGLKTINWNVSGMASGTYFYRIKTNEFSAIKKCIVIK